MEQRFNLICVDWHKSRSETYWKLKFSSKIWNVTHDFVYFSDLEQ